MALVEATVIGLVWDVVTLVVMVSVVGICVAVLVDIRRERNR